MIWSCAQAQSDADIAVISRVVKSLISELQQEHADIVRLQSLSDDYEKQRTSLVPWLDARPDVVDKLRAVMSNIASVKSRIRHRMADCQDLQEVTRKIS